MKLYVIKVKWRYEDEPVTIGVCDAEHIEELKNIYMGKYFPVKDSIVGFDIDDYELNTCY